MHRNRLLLSYQLFLRLFPVLPSRPHPLIDLRSFPIGEIVGGCSTVQTDREQQSVRRVHTHLLSDDARD